MASLKNESTKRENPKAKTLSREFLVAHDRKLATRKTRELQRKIKWRSEWQK